MRQEDIERHYSRTGRLWATREKDGWSVHSWDSGVLHQGLSLDSAKVKLDRLDPAK